MNQLTIHGNITDKPELRHNSSGEAILNVSVAVNRRRFDRQSGQWRDLGTVYHRVVAFNSRLAENAANLPKGTAVTVTGELADDSWTAEDGRQMRRTQLIAEDIAVSLRFATVEITRNPRAQREGDDNKAAPDNVHQLASPRG